MSSLFGFGSLILSYHCSSGPLPQVEVVSVITLFVVLVVTAAGQLCIRAGAPLTSPGPLIADLLHLLPVVTKLEAHVYDAADPVLVEGNLGVPAWVALPTSQASCNMLFSC